MKESNNSELGYINANEGVGDAAILLNDSTSINAQIHRAVAGISETITVDGMINLDVSDLRLILENAGTTWMSTAATSGGNRAKSASNLAIASLALQGVDIAHIHRVLINITSNSVIKLNEVHQVLNCIKSAAAQNALIITSTTVDEKPNDELRVTLFAIGRLTA